ncbi:hypothetical protein [Roseovarius sp. TE539]|uniref:hypothetical protein n=1 Tax=Roseovarius sp. TE539 TaxID=2249812 RepID=UPI00215C3ED1|nr:hypothetical protein [Roseovarius sp. TE539]
MPPLTFLEPLAAVLRHEAHKAMDIILHLGAHRTATTSFQHLIRENQARFEAEGLGFWGPRRTRNGLLTGVIPVPGPQSRDAQLQRAAGRISLAVEQAARLGLRQILVSDENMIGTPRRTLRDGSLYPDIGERMARFARAFGGRIARVSLSIRGQDSLWPSLMAFSVARGARIPDDCRLRRIADSRRGWRDVITDLACALPDTPIQIFPHEIHAGTPERRLALMTGRERLPACPPPEWLNRTPDLWELRHRVAERGGDPEALPPGPGRWQPFGQAQCAALGELYGDDLFWLRSGADGLAELTEETDRKSALGKAPAGQMRRGRPNGFEERRLA